MIHSGIIWMRRWIEKNENISDFIIYVCHFIELALQLFFSFFSNVYIRGAIIIETKRVFQVHVHLCQNSEYKGCDTEFQGNNYYTDEQQKE